MALKERLLEVMQECGLHNQTQLADFLGVTRGLVTQWFNGAAGLGKKPLESIDEKTRFSPRWVKDGTGNKYKDNQSTEEKTDYITFEVLNISAKMGNGIINPDFVEAVDAVVVAKQWAREQLGGNLNTIKVITARGDSMQPTIEDSCVLFVDESVQYYDGEGVYVIATPDGLKAKRLHLTLSGSLNIISDNPRYPVETVEKEQINDIKICGKVKGCWKMDRL